MSPSALHHEVVIQWIISFGDPDLLRQAVRFASGPARVRLATAYWINHPEDAVRHLADLIGRSGRASNNAAPVIAFQHGNVLLELYLDLLSEKGR